MSPDNWTQLVVVLLAAALAAAGLGWVPAGRPLFAPAAAVLLAAAALVAALPAELADGRVALTVVVVVAGALAVAGGGPLTARIFDIVDRGQQDTAVANAGSILRGGAWIGALERLAVFAGLAAGFPEGVAVVLALKGVGRYPDLKAESGGAATERFIIGTFASVLWAAGCAGLVALVRR